MTLIGKHYSTNANGERVTTLHVSDDFNSYYENRDAGRGCEGQKVDTIYVGTYDVSSLKIGMMIDISYEKAISTSKGTFQSVKRIDIVGK